LNELTNREKRKRKKGEKEWKYFRNYIKIPPNLTEKICFILGAMGISHAIICSDIDSWANRISFESVNTLNMGFCITAGLHIAIILVRAWITVIDGGKTKQTPTWCKW